MRPWAPGTDARIFTVAPVNEVMTRLGAGPRMVRDFIGRQAARRRQILGHLPERPRLFGVRYRELAGFVKLLEHRVGFDGELVEREVFGRAVDGACEFRLPCGGTLARTRVDEVKGKSIEMRRRDRHGGQGFLCAM